MASGRLSYAYGFKGPAVSVDTACSSSLVAAHLAATCILTGVTTAGLTAGVGLLLSPDTTAMFHKAGMLASDGRCKSLDLAADGYVRGEAAGVLLLQAIAPPAAQGRALAVFRGSAVNQDGRSSSLTAPNGPSQQGVIHVALEAAGLAVQQVAGLQLHGTGTALGDPIEMGAATSLLVDGRTASRPFTLLASKSALGHSEPASGIMGLAFLYQVGMCG